MATVSVRPVVAPGVVRLVVVPVASWPSALSPTDSGDAPTAPAGTEDSTVPSTASAKHEPGLPGIVPTARFDAGAPHPDDRVGGDRTGVRST